MAIFTERDGINDSSLAAMDLANADCNLVHEVVVACVGKGWLLSFGSSRDGGATSIAVLSDAGKERAWASGDDELSDALRAVYKAATGVDWRQIAESPQRAGEGATEPSHAKSESGGRGRKAGLDKTV